MGGEGPPPRTWLGAKMGGVGVWESLVSILIRNQSELYNHTYNMKIDINTNLREFALWILPSSWLSRVRTRPRVDENEAITGASPGPHRANSRSWISFCPFGAGTPLIHGFLLGKQCAFIPYTCGRFGRSNSAPIA